MLLLRFRGVPAIFLAGEINQYPPLGNSTKVYFGYLQANQTESAVHAIPQQLYEGTDTIRAECKIFICNHQLKKVSASRFQALKLSNIAGIY